LDSYLSLEIKFGIILKNSKKRKKITRAKF